MNFVIICTYIKLRTLARHRKRTKPGIEIVNKDHVDGVYHRTTPDEGDDYQVEGVIA